VVHEDVTHQNYTLTAEQRSEFMGQKPVVVWLTGLPGSGKSTLADALERRLFTLGKHTMVLDGDNVRSGLNSDLAFGPNDRQENVRRVAEVAKLMCDAGIIPIVALVSPFSDDRDMARHIFADNQFIEVWVETPPQVCAERDPKGLWKKAKQGKIKNLTGFGQDYEAPSNPEVHVHGDSDLDKNTEAVVDEILARQ
jgi:adenylyl-sulfate kinase